MKLDSKQKYERIRRYMAQIKSRPNIQPFFSTEEIAKYGIYDFCYITKNPSSFGKIQKKLKESKYDDLWEFIDELKQIFIAVGDYAFEDDPIQGLVQSFQEDIDRFAQKFNQDFKTSNVVYTKPRPSLELPKQKVKQEPKVIPPPIIPIIEQVPIMPMMSRSTNLAEKLQMLFLLRANQNNQPYIRSIGSAYRIGEQIQDEYVITLDNKNTSWMQFLNKHD